MSDIAERLRQRQVTRWVHSTGRPPRADGFALDLECIEAADEIDRLRAEVERLTVENKGLELLTKLRQSPDAALIEECDALKARLEAAFRIDETQAKKLKEWVDGHDAGQYAGAIGGVYTYSFTPTSLGEALEVKNNATGESINLTDFDSW